MIIWNDAGTTQKPKGWVLVAVLLPNGKNKTHIASWTAKFSEENCGDYDEYCDYNEEDDTYYTPEGWYQELNVDADYSGMFLSEPVVAWADLPEYKV